MKTGKTILITWNLDIIIKLKDQLEAVRLAFSCITFFLIIERMKEINIVMSKLSPDLFIILKS